MRERRDQAALRKFGSTLAEMRLDADLSQEELADRSGLHRTYIGSVERGERNPTVISILRIAKGLGCAPSEMLRRPFS
jgi:transcriptional regulator with XRE-family HTH domain